MLYLQVLNHLFINVQRRYKSTSTKFWINLTGKLPEQFILTRYYYLITVIYIRLFSKEQSNLKLEMLQVQIQK